MQSMFYVEGPMDLPWGAYGMRVLLPLVARNVSDPADTFDLARPYSAGCGSACYSEATQTKAWWVPRLLGCLPLGSWVTACCFESGFVRLGTAHAGSITKHTWDADPT